ncbi:TRAP transporter large permease [Bacillus sp. ISL-47]|uniref:TRAP transporter large permease n=1 Tax=Bacillus sp. ISL-47 TaxID=2819130 RepID=UPI001BE8E151|nr:TRAP transporter large permease [Bacillus sp. ISL-47]MBT2686799.1 TRAP transporter large permease [Bacillus sp. ISL-47]MBT2706848.1 TRAP transporter large permease [Pseudomonas sp. ISL-84]
MPGWFIFILLIFLLLGIPIAFALGGISSISILLDGSPITQIAQGMFTGIDSFPLIAIPLFILAGELMAKGGMTRRLIDFANSLVGHFPSGLAIVSVLACILFAAITGSAIAATAAVGGIMIPIMKKEGYDVKFVAPLLACAGTIGPIIPPSIPLLIYGTSANVSIAELFIGGIIPGILMGIGLIIASFIIGKARRYKGRDKRAELKVVLITGKDAVLALLTPLIIIGGIISGSFTATESAVIAVFYAWIISMFIYRELKIKDLYETFKSSAILTGQILIIVSAAGLFTRLLTINQVPQKVSDFILSFADSPGIFLLVINIILLIAGTFIDTTSAIVVFTPIFMPVVQSFGLDPVHFGVLMTMNLSIGMVTPPLGVCLFVACSIGKISIKEMVLSKDLWIFICVLILVLGLVTYIPSLVLFGVELFT